MLERRQNRSDSRPAALTLLLESLVRESDAGSAALVTGDGVLVAGAGARDSLGALAAAIPSAFAGDASSPWEAATGGRDLYARAVDVDGNRFYLASVGAPVRHARNAEDGIRRIYSL